MKEPKRLTADPDEPETFRHALGRMRNVPYDTNRGLARFGATVATGAVLGATASTSKASAKGIASKVFGASGLVKTAGVALVVTGALASIVGTFTSDRRRTVEAEQPPASVQAPVAAAGEAEVGPSTSIADAVGENAVNENAVPAIDPVAAAPSVRPARPRRPQPPAVRPTSARTVPPPDDRLVAETNHLAEVRRALGSDPARALALAEAGAVEFKGGVFTEERESLVVAALARMGRTSEARVHAERFVASHPRSPLVESVKRDAHLE